MREKFCRVAPRAVPSARPASRAAILAGVACMIVTVGTLAQTPDASDWGYYGGDMFGQRFSSLNEINRKNVAHLSVAWTYHTGETGAGFARANKMSFEATPVLAFGLLYLETPTNILIALDPETGVQKWRFDPHIDRTRP